MSAEDDQRRVRRAALSIGVSVGIASAVIIAAGVGILIAAILLNRRREGDESGGPAVGRRGDEFVIDADHILPVVIIVGIAGVALLSLVAWFAARRSVGLLGDALRLQREFVADASHELRTPLTALTSRIQVLQRRRERGEPIDDTVLGLRRDAAMMADVLSDLLLAAEGEAGAGPSSATVVEAASAAIESLRPVADDADVELTLALATDARVGLPHVTLVRLLIALLDNAVQHAPPGSAVTVQVESVGGLAQIRVSDRGTGIHGIAPEAVFERFARSSESGRRRSFGLGLSLVRDVAVRAGGGVEVERTSEDGTTFLLRLPTVG